MIEFANFGAGFRVDGPDWGASTRPYLEHDWRQLPPGAHELQPEQADFVDLHWLTVLKDGRGLLSVIGRPDVWAKASPAARNMAERYAPTTIVLDGVRQFCTLVNVKYSELGEPGDDMDVVMKAIRLTGIVRYNPDVY